VFAHSLKWWHAATVGVVVGALFGVLAPGTVRGAARDGGSSGEGVLSLLVDDGEPPPTLTAAPSLEGPGERPEGDLRVVFNRPTDLAPYHSQVQVGFDAPLIPLANVADPRRSEALSHFSITPTPPGEFRMVGTQAVVFSPKSPFPASSAYTLTIKAGLKDIHGRELTEDFSWQLHTEPLELSLSDLGYRGVSLRPRFTLSGNGPVKESVLASHLSCVEVLSDDEERPVDVQWLVTADKDNPPPIQEITDYRRSCYYYLKPSTPLTRHTQYRLTLGAGVEPLEGTLPSAEEASLTFSTYAPLELTFESDHDGRWLESTYRVRANNALDEETVRDSVSISPPIEGKVAWANPQSPVLHLPEGTLRPDTEYTLTVGTGLRDIYEQRLLEPWVYAFRTAHLRPQINVLGGTSLLTPRTQAVLPFRAINPDVVNAEVLPVSEEGFLRWCFDPRQESCGQVLDAHPKLTRKRSYSLAEDAIEIRDLRLAPSLEESDLRLALYRLRATRPSSAEWRTKPVETVGAVLRTNLALHAQLLPAEMHVWATHLMDGSPAGACRVAVYRYPGEGAHVGERPALLASGYTDAQGQLRLPATELRGADGSGERYLSSPARFVAMARDGNDFAYLADRDWLGTKVYLPYGTVSPGWDGTEVFPLGRVFSDRQLYQPSEEVKLKGVVRYRVEDRLEAPVGLELAVRERDPQGEATDLGTVTTDEFGTFTLTVEPRPGDSLGYYEVTASATSPEVSISGAFRRADFEPPRYKAELTTDKQLYSVGETIHAQAVADYLFGAPMAGGSGTFRVTARPQEFRPEGWDGFSFGIPEWVYRRFEDRETPERSLVEQTKELDDRGHATLDVPAIAQDEPACMAYDVEVEVKDVSGQSIGASETVPVLPYSHLSGVALKKPFVPEKTPCSAQVVVTDPDGHPVSGVNVRVELSAIRWEYKEVERDGDREWDYVVETEVVQTRAVTSGREPVTVSLTPPAAGEYLIIARFAGRSPTGTEGAGWLYASGPSVGERGRLGTEVELLLDKDKYEAGDEVQVAVPSPFARARMLLSIERERIFEQRCEEIPEGVSTVRFRVTDEMVPNVYVQVSLTELGPKGGNLYEDPGHYPYRIGFADVAVSPALHRLSVKVSPKDAACRPGDTAAVEFHAEDAAGKPAQVQLTVMVVDEAILQMTGYRPPDLVAAVFPHRDLSLELFDNRRLVVHAGRRLRPLPKGWGYDGGEGPVGLAGAYLRKDFQRLAHFDADLRTDEQGNARCEFRVPDSLTTWRVLAVAVSRENDFGAGDATFVVNQPLMLQGLLPRFARVDDSITTGVAISNHTGAAGKATVTCSLTKGDDLLKPVGEPLSSQSVDVANNRTGAIRFPKSAVGVGDCTIQFECVLGDDEHRATDRLQLPLVVQEPGYWETVAISREVREALKIPIDLTDAVRNDLGHVRVSLSSTAFGDLAPDVEWLLKYPYGCAEQLASRLLGLLAIEEPARLFGMTIESGRPLRQVITDDLTGLLACQQSDGGFAYWSRDSRSSPLLTAYVAVVLAEARRHGCEVPRAAWQRVTDYLKAERDESPWSEEEELHYRVLQAQALNALGSDYTEHYGDLVTRRENLSLLDVIRLDGLLYQREDWQEQASMLHDEIGEHEWITERGVQVEDWRDTGDAWAYMETTTALTAAGLRLGLLVDPGNERTAKMASSLVAGRQTKRWRDTYDTAQALDAICRYVEVREATEPAFTARVAMDDKQPAAFTFQGYKLGLQSRVFPLAELGAGPHRLALDKEGEGTLYSTVELQYVPKGQQPPQSQGFFIERAMTNLRTGKAVKGTDEAIPVGDIVRVRLTLNAPQDAYNVVVEAPVPAGLETVDTSFETTPKWAVEEESNSDRWWRTPFDHTEFHRDHVALFAQEMPAGVYVYEYLLQATNPGDFTYPPTRIYRMYEPEEFGCTESGRVRVAES